VYPSHIQLKVMRAVASTPGQPMRSLKERLDGADVGRVREHFRGAGGWAWVVELGEVARALAEETWKQVVPLKAEVDMRDVSEWATGCVARLYAERAATPDREQLRELREHFLETRAGAAARVRRNARLSDAELTEDYRARYDELWGHCCVGGSPLRARWSDVSSPRSTTSAAIQLRWVPLPAGGHRAGSALVPACATRRLVISTPRNKSAPHPRWGRPRTVAPAPELQDRQAA
jgi:hypothetical protein